MKISSEGGFIAVVSAVIIAAVLLVVTVSLSMTGLFARFNILETEYKERSLALAEACADIALLKLAADPSYTGGPPAITIGSSNCDILAINPNASPIVIRTKASFPQSATEKAVTNLVVTVGNPSLNVISWTEVPN